jgi:hypothetical protein
MFPLAGTDFPTTSDELASAVQSALATVFTLPGNRNAVSVDGGTFPDVTTLRLELDDASVSAAKPPPRPIGVGQRSPGITVERLEISGRPIRYQNASLELDVTASGLTLDFDRDNQGNPLLVLTDARDGRVQAKIAKADLQAVLLEAAKLAARQQGVAVQDLKVDLESLGPRSVAARVRVQAKKMMMSGVVNIKGQLEVDDELNATVSGLGVSGEGVVGGMAAGLLQQKLRSYDGTKIPLMAFSLGDVTLRDLEIKVTDAVQVNAAFGRT